MFHVNYIPEDKLQYSAVREALKAKNVDKIHADRVLVLSPHPDDDVIGCGGLLSYLAEAGSKIRVVCFFDGAKGNPDGKPENELVREREEEAVEALRVIKVHEIHFMRLKESKPSEKIVERILLELKTGNFDLVLPPGRTDWHPDHKSVAEGLRKALKHQIKHRPVVWSYSVWGLPDVNRIFPIGKYIAQKREAIREHKSQLKIKPYDEMIFDLNRYLGRALAESEYAEGYFEENDGKQNLS